MRRTLAALALALACSQAGAGYDEAVEAYRRGDHAVALEEFRALAERGVVVAYTNLGNAHFKLGNLDQARQAWEKAVELDPSNARAAANLQQVPDGEAEGEPEPEPSK